MLCTFLLCFSGRAVSSMSYLIPSGLFLVLPFSVPGRTGLEKALFVLDQMAQPLLETVGCERRAPCVASAPLPRPGLLPSTQSLATEGCEMGAVGTSALLAAPSCFLRRESCESAFNLSPLALSPAEIPQSWWHTDGMLSYFPMPKQISPIFTLPWSFLSLAEGGSLGGSWTSVLSFTIFLKSFTVNSYPYFVLWNTDI